jgi:hypothetical protein
MLRRRGLTGSYGDVRYQMRDEKTPQQQIIRVIRALKFVSLTMK